MEISQILNELERNTGTFPRRAVEAAVEAREEITLDWLQPHEGNIVEFLFRPRAFQSKLEKVAS